MSDIKQTSKIKTKTPATKSSKHPRLKKTNLATPQNITPPQHIPPQEQTRQSVRSNNIEQLQDIVKRAHDIISIYMDTLKLSHVKNAIRTPNGAMLTASKSMLKLAVDLIRSPGVMTKTNIKYALGVSKIISANFLGKTTPTPFEKRFKSKAWSDNINYNTLKEVYLYTCDTIMETIRTVSRADPQSRTVTEFYIQRLTDMFSPSNFPLTNPDVIATTIEEKGANILRGLNNFLEDLERGKGVLDISMVDTSKYQIGKNIAATPGIVVYRNDFIELLHYQPQKENITATPILFVPPWINKYYILDLQQENSFVKWLLDQGQNVFLISWYNPGTQQAHWDFEDYMSEGVLTALSVVREVAASEKVNMIGYCIGGTLLSATLAYLKATHQDVVASATFMTTLIDFNQSGELKVFLDETQIKLLEKRTKRIGYMEKKAFTNVFNLLRANDLIWSFIVNNYYLGKQPPALDILFWNTDATRMTSTLQSFYLRNMYLYNLLTRPGGITLKGVPIDLSCINIPVFFIASKEDHIAPWKGVYDGVKLFKSAKSFILSGSGHIAGMINPPMAHKYHYWINNEIPDSPEKWLENAQQHMGSWWPTWKEWLNQNLHNKTQVPAAKTLNHPKYPALEKAPGQYIKIL